MGVREGGYHEGHRSVRHSLGCPSSERRICGKGAGGKPPSSASGGLRGPRLLPNIPGRRSSVAERKVDLVLTDPPYGIGYRSTLARRGRRKQGIANDAAEEYEAFLQKALPAIRATMRKGDTLLWFAGGGGAEPVLAKALLAISEHFTLLNTLVWDKVDPGLGWRWRRSWEAIVEASLGKPRVWNGGTEARNVLRFAKAIPQAEEHPTPKPVPLLEELIKATSPSRGLVLDPFAGSGPTLVSAERTGRICFAVELEPRYCDIILVRWEALTGCKAAGAPLPPLERVARMPVSKRRDGIWRGKELRRV